MRTALPSSTLPHPSSSPPVSIAVPKHPQLISLPTALTLNNDPQLSAFGWLKPARTVIRGLDTGRLRIETAVVRGILDMMMLLLDDAGERQAARFNAMQSAMRSHCESGLGNTDRLQGNLDNLLDEVCSNAGMTAGTESWSARKTESKKPSIVDISLEIEIYCDETGPAQGPCYRDS